MYHSLKAGISLFNKIARKPQVSSVCDNASQQLQQHYRYCRVRAWLLSLILPSYLPFSLYKTIPNHRKDCIYLNLLCPWTLMSRITFRHISTGIAQDWLIRANLYSPYINFGQTLQTYINFYLDFQKLEKTRKILCVSQ